MILSEGFLKDSLISKLNIYVYNLDFIYYSNAN